MADAASRKALKEIRKEPGNSVCAECGKLNPQWVCVTYGLWVCIECSGKHRMLGLALSQVKSITMDKWTPKEIERVKMGGNRPFKEFVENHPSYDASWSFEEKYNSAVYALYRDKITMEAAGEVWTEEDSPIAAQMKDDASVSAVDVKTGEEKELKPAQVVEVEVQEPLDTFSRLGQGLSIATNFVRETTKQAAEELNEFKDANATLESTKQNVSGALSSWGCWASSLAKSVSDKLDDQLSQMAEQDKKEPDPAEGDLGGSFWSSFGNKKPPTMCMSVSTISEPEDN